jgi:hypothetical protein
LPVVEMKVAALPRANSHFRSISRSSTASPKPHVVFGSGLRGGCLRGFFWALIMEGATLACVGGAILVWRVAHF